MSEPNDLRIVEPDGARTPVGGQQLRYFGAKVGTWAYTAFVSYDMISGRLVERRPRPGEERHMRRPLSSHSWDTLTGALDHVARGQNWQELTAEEAEERAKW